MSKKTIRYDDEFKAHTVKMVIEQNKTKAEVASDLGVYPTDYQKMGETSHCAGSIPERLLRLAR